MTRLHLCLTVLWVVLLIPTLLWWRDSVLWVAVMSWYAIVASHVSGYQSGRTEELVERQASRERPGPAVSGDIQPKNRRTMWDRAAIPR